jgi:amidohydrolase
MTTPIADAVPVELRETLIALRHDLHQHPELSFQEERTATQLTRHLEAIAPGAVERVAGTGLLARIRGTARGAPTVAIRGDIDALPIQEDTGIEFQSIHPGVMHACGHDVHAAWAVGAAYLLAASPAVGDVMILLQPGEETGRGAPAVLDTGALNQVQAIFGAHVDMRFELGQVVAEPGPIAGSTDEFFVEIAGRGAHAARPHEARDPIIAAAALVTALQRIVARRLAPGEPGVVTVGTLHAGTAENIIPEFAKLSGTLRAVRPETRELLKEELKITVGAVATAHGVGADLTIRPGTPPIVNRPDAIHWAQAAVRSLAGDDALVSLPSPNLAGEDFAFYLERIRGCFLRIGARAPGDEPQVSHSPRFLPHDDTVLVGSAILAETARRASADLAAAGR